jgi:pimeloyl-ACP methyl ester carboxylesterase
MVYLKWTFIIAAVGYLSLGAIMFFAQRALMYFPEGVRTAPAAAGLPQAEEVTLDSGAEKIIAWHLPPRGNRPVVLYFHGNGGALRLRADRFKKLAAAGIGVIALSYRGYGGSSGQPTEAGLIEDARAAYAFAAVRYPGRIMAWGESLGSGVAIALAAEKPLNRLILESPFTSTVDIAAAQYWFLPVRLLMKDQFRSDLRVGRVTVPVLIMHGDADGIVPIQYGQRLFSLIPGKKRMVRFPGGGHNDLDAFGASGVALKFIEER